MSRMFIQRSNVKLSASTSTTTNAGRVHLVHVNGYMDPGCLVIFKSGQQAGMMTMPCLNDMTPAEAVIKLGPSLSIHQVTLLPAHTCALTVPYSTHTYFTTNTTNTLSVLTSAHMGDFSDYHLSIVFPDSCCGGDHRQRQMDRQTDGPTD